MDTEHLVEQLNRTLDQLENLQRVVGVIAALAVLALGISLVVLFLVL